MRWFSFSLLAIAWLTAFLPADSPAKNDPARRRAAEEKEDRPLKKIKKLKRGKDACDAVKDSCIFAGFAKNGPPGKDLKKDCYEILFLGMTVPRVHLSPEIIASCKTLKEKAAEQEEN